MKKFLLGLFLLVTMPVQSAVINGGFSNNDGWVDASWAPIPGDEGTASIDNGVAKLQTAGGGITGGYNSSWAQGTDADFFSFSSTTVVDGNWLNFDFFFDNSLVDSNETGPVPAGDDYFSVTLLTLTDFDNSDVGLAFTGGFDFSLTELFAALDVSAYLDQTVILAFDLHDEADQKDAILSLDNVEFSDTERQREIANLAPQTVPEPAGVVLLLISGLLGRKFLKR